MSEVVHRIDAPLIACIVMRSMNNSVDYRVSHVDVRACHIDLGAEAYFSVSELAGSHLLEQFEILLDWSVSVWAFLARLLESASVFSDLIRSKFTYERFALLDKLNGSLVHCIKIVRCPEFLIPLESEPVNVSLNGLNEFNIFLGRICIIVSQIASAAVLECSTEIQAEGLSVSDMQISVRFRGKSCYDLLVLAGCQVIVNDVMDKISGHVFIFFCCCKCHSHTPFRKSLIVAVSIPHIRLN